MAGVAKQEDIDNQRVSDSEEQKLGAKGNSKEDVEGEKLESGYEKNDPERPFVLGGDTSPLLQEMDGKALTEISMVENPSSWLEEPLNEDQQSTVSHFSCTLLPQL